MTWRKERLRWLETAASESEDFPRYDRKKERIDCALVRCTSHFLPWGIITNMATVVSPPLIKLLCPAVDSVNSWAAGVVQERPNPKVQRKWSVLRFLLVRSVAPGMGSRWRRIYSRRAASAVTRVRSNTPTRCHAASGSQKLAAGSPAASCFLSEIGCTDS